MAAQVDTKIENARKELEELISKEKFNATDLLRLAYASQFATANVAAGVTTSTNATATTTTQSTTDNNNKLKTAIGNIKVNHPTLTNSDLYQLAGVVAVKALGGPNIVFVPGRKESLISPDEGCLPDGKQDLRVVFNRVGISEDKDIVALCGGLKLARKIQGPKTEETLKFDNSYFAELVKIKNDSSVTKLPLDKALLDDSKFYSYVQLYATNVDTFLKDYEAAHKKLSDRDLELSHSPFRSTLESVVQIPAKQMAVGVAVAAAVVIFSIFYLINRRRAKHTLQ